MPCVTPPNAMYHAPYRYEPPTVMNGWSQNCVCPYSSIVAARLKMWARFCYCSDPSIFVRDSFFIFGFKLSRRLLGSLLPNLYCQNLQFFGGKISLENKLLKWCCMLLCVCSAQMIHVLLQGVYVHRDNITQLLDTLRVEVTQLELYLVAGRCHVYLAMHNFECL